MTDQEFCFLVDGLISSRPHNRPPLITDFREARLKIEKRIFEAGFRSKEPTPKIHCEMCLDCGVIPVKSRADGKEVFMHCVCERDPQRRWLGPYWELPIW